MKSSADANKNTEKPKPEAPAQVAAPVQTNAVKPHINSKYDWYQNASFIFLTFKVVGDKELAKRAKVDFTDNSVSVSWDD